MKRILIFTGRYLPGYKDGGPLRTIQNVVDALGDEYEFYIACLDRDHGDQKPYPEIVHDQWNRVGKAQVWYVRPGKFSFSLIRKLTEYADLIYSCSFYNDYGYKLLLLNRFGFIKKKVVVAAMGVFSKGALSQKAWKKSIFLSLCKATGLFKHIQWSVTSNLELQDVVRIVGKDAVCQIAEDLPRVQIPGIKPEKTFSGRLKIVFLSRISPMKNLTGAIRCLKNIETNVDFDIYGPNEDCTYWNECKAQLEQLPACISWKYLGAVHSEQVQQKLQEYDVLLLPTKGENFGHIIFEALSVGCIPVISDRTLWGMIAERKAGYVLPLSEHMLPFSDAIKRVADMSPQERKCMAKNAVKVAEEKVMQAEKETGYRTIFG